MTEKETGSALAKRVFAVGLQLSRPQIFLAVTSTVIASLSPIALPLLFGSVINRLLAGDTIDQLTPSIAIMVTLLLLGAIASFASTKLAISLGFEASTQISGSVFEHVLKMPFLTYTTINKGVLISRLTNDIRMLEPLFIEVPLVAIRGWSGLAGTAIALAVLDPWYLVCFAVVPISILLVRYAEARINNAIGASFEHSAELAALTENISTGDAVSLVRQSRSTEIEIKNFKKKSRIAAENAETLEFWRVMIRVAYDTSFGIVSIMLLLTGAILVECGVSTIGNVVSAILYIGLLRYPLSDLVGLRYPLRRGSMGLRRVEEVLTSPNTGLTSISTKEEPYAATAAVIPTTPRLPVLAFKDVWFRYPTFEEIGVKGLTGVEASHAAMGFVGALSLTSLEPASIESRSERKWVLRGVNLSLRRGESLAITGISGAGKSTLVALTCGLVRPTSGELSILGDDTAKMAEEEIWRHVSLVSQDIYLRGTTLRDNLLCVKLDASEAELMEACDRAGLSEMLRNLPLGLNTQVGNQGRRFSGGERQRISIARAFLKNSELIVLDEATSHLDPRKEANILESIESLRSSKAILVIAHRRSAIQQTDSVIMLEDGMVVESGSYNCLLNSGGPFARMQAELGGSAVP